MYKIHVSNREIVVPGDAIVTIEKGDVEVSIETPFVEKIDDTYYSTIVGLALVEESEEGKLKLSVIPLEGAYIPRPGDIVVGLVEDIGITHWEVDIRSPYRAILPAQDVLGRPFNPASENLSHYFDVGDYLVAKIASFSRNRDPVLTVKDKGLGRVTSGLVVEIKPSRVPRVIGKKASMITMLTRETGCDMIVGQNGRIVVKCKTREDEDIAVKAIRLIEELAHTSGLTDKVREFIRREKSSSTH